MDFFFQLHRGLLREGPGDDQSTAQAFNLCRDLPPNPRILDIGCGPGAQTLALARLAPRAAIYAFDLHLPFLRDLKQRVHDQDRAVSILPLRASMYEIPFAPASFDLIWSEGAIYIRGFESGLHACWNLLKPGGCVAVTELSWIQPNPPAEAADFWAADYPAMRTREQNQSIIDRLGYRALGSFVLPETAWIDNYYLPIQRRAAEMRRELESERGEIPNRDLQSMLAASQLEFDTYRKYSAWYGYVFYIMQKP